MIKGQIMFRQSHSKTSIFLIEMIIVILLLALASALCVQVFVAAHEKSVGAGDLSRAKTLARGAGELIVGSGKQKKTDLSMLDVYYPDGKRTEDGVYMHYDSEWQVCDAKDAVFAMEFLISEKGGYRFGDIRVFNVKTNKDIYTLNVKVHVRYRVGED